MESLKLSLDSQKILNEHLRELDIAHDTISINGTSRPGENFCGIINYITVNSQKPLHLVIKTAPDNPIIRKAYPIHEMYETEQHFYTYILPELSKLQKEHKIQHPFISLPKLYKANLEEGKEVIVLEDMTKSGFETKNLLKTVDYDHAVCVIRQYGRLHALSFALKVYKPNIFEKIKRNTSTHILERFNYDETRLANYKQRMDAILKCVDKNEDKVAYETFLKFSEQIVNVIKKVVNTDRAGEHAVLTHCDGWISNFMFKYENSSVPTSVCFLDWQLAHFGSPALDLSFFIFACTSEAFRKNHYKDLIQEYYKSLSKSLAEFGLEAETIFPFTVLEEHLKKFSAYGLFMCLLVLNVTLLQGKGVPGTLSTQLKMGSAGIPQPPDAEDYKLYCSRMRGILLDFANFGFEVEFTT